MAFSRESALAGRIARVVEAEPWPAAAAIARRLRLARVARALMRPDVFTFTGFPRLCLASRFDARPDVYLWERVRLLTPLPSEYCERYSNVQAALGLSGLQALQSRAPRGMPA